MNTENLEKLRRVSVVGTSCSGKTTFAKSLSQILQVKHTELDALYWLPDWVERPSEEFLKLVEASAAEENWVLDGNYTRAREIFWERATAIVWLNYSFPRTYYRALKRTISRVLSGEEMWSGNRETFRQSFFSRDSILLWVLTSYFDKRRRYSKILNDEKLKEKNILIFRHPKQAENFLQQIREIKNS